MLESPPSDLTARMREDWDRRAREDHKLHIATGHAGSEEAFRESGRHDVEEVILDGLWLSPAASVLEIGCGVGRLLLPVAERVDRAHGIDIAPTMIAKANAYAEGRGNVTFAVTDGSLGVPDGSLDFAYSFIVFQHIPDKAPIEAYVRGAARALAPGGVFRFQVDGRWRERAGWRADTYDGVVWAPDEIRGLARDAGLELVEEWGAETHYHRLTCRRPGEGAGVRLFGSAWDAPFVRALLESTGAPPGALDGVLAGKTTLRAALDGLEARYGALSPEKFVHAIYRVVLRRAPDAGGLRFHAGVLESGHEDRASLVETILMGNEFRSLARPPLEPTWVVREALARRWPEPARREGTGALADRLERDLAAVPDAQFVAAAFDAVAARPPDANDTFDYAPVLESGPAARRALLLRLLSRGGLPAAPPPPSRRDALFSRCGAEPRPEIRRGESFAGEAEAARSVLGDGWALATHPFVSGAYERVLGRAADEGGAAYYADLLDRGVLSRPEFVRELLWSDELRR